MTHWLQSIAIGLQVLIGALTTALGAALSGKKVRDITLSVSLFRLNTAASRRLLQFHSSAVLRHL